MAQPIEINNKTIIGIDLGGTNIRAGSVRDKEITVIRTERINSQLPAEEIMQQVFGVVDSLISDNVFGIGIGVPGLVNEERGIVFDVINIPSWKEVPLKNILEERYQVPVLINNDANCFAVGEYHFGKGKGSGTMIGMTIGTGLGSGIIFNGKLYSGKNCGAGEFGMIDYLDNYLEYYASGQFFHNVYKIDGEEVFRKASANDPSALNMYEEFGKHLGNAIKIILYALEPDTIVFGGSVRKAWPFFQQAMWKRVQTFAYKQTVENLRIEISELENSGILGAAALHYNIL